MKCPECGREIGLPRRTDMKTLGWVCTDCDIKIYKEIGEAYICRSCLSIVKKENCMGFCPMCLRDSLEVL